MQTVIIFLIIFFSILIFSYPIIRIIYFISNKENIRNKILNLIIIIASQLIVYFRIKNMIGSILNLDFGKYINSQKEIILIFISIFIGNIIETIINTIINYSIKKRIRNK